MQVLYNLLFYLATPFILLRLLWRSYRAPAYLRRWSERFGFIPLLPKKPVILIHSVSVGEVHASLPLIRRLLDRYPDHVLLITTMTPTGSDQVKKYFDSCNRVIHYYLPYDLPDCVSRFLKRSQPKLAIIFETELWPNLLSQCKYRNIPVILANARLSKRSARRYAYLSLLAQKMLSVLTYIAAQSTTDSRRFITLGADPNKVSVMGNLKFEIDFPSDLESKGYQLRQRWGGIQRPIWIAASTHQGEEKQVLEGFKQVQEFFPKALLVLVPRHPERFHKVYQLCKHEGFTIQRRSQSLDCTLETNIFLGDSMGELPLFFAAADIVFLGGSLVPIGGHNPLEAAALGKGIILGPYTFNFANISKRLLKVDAAIQISSPQSLTQTVLFYFNNPDKLIRAGQKGKEFVIQNQGASEKLLTLVESCLNRIEV
ncbi:lipid IV(A) 3-deoxy-D-manno-octulosonic acid transferase [Candidatus Nitrosacidococcus sp. I8]|uniref:lipid IV(A) 3-deoxy-D-manno-octulosonic acid transferase n=1 Tax=Candidatus Nitrosacidococcus sp. I8 TaxID=2942908 RepID=UPI00222718F1|nr:lipid IV(A) 3-deoxy-D-manno-octulosonic acid transferase [Candidatus Nitrosacidococcus sp. I8]CAH9015368.1 3-deoxy-D-manno-octulosonic acid transferase [Candidatus Nitrosacidococcus sp. I8]